MNALDEELISLSQAKGCYSASSIRTRESVLTVLAQLKKMDFVMFKSPDSH